LDWSEVGLERKNKHRILTKSTGRYEIWDFHGDEDSYRGPLGCDVI